MGERTASVYVNGANPVGRNLIVTRDTETYWAWLLTGPASICPAEYHTLLQDTERREKELFGPEANGWEIWSWESV